MLRASGGGWPDPVKYYRSFSGDDVDDQIYVDDKSFTATLTLCCRVVDLGELRDLVAFSFNC